MDVNQYIAELPEQIEAREERFYDDLCVGRHIAFTLSLVDVSRAIGSVPVKAQVLVLSDAVRIGDTRGWLRINATAKLAQRIADHFDMLLPTARIWDSVANQVKPLKPCTQPWNKTDRLSQGYSPSMSDNGAMLRSSQDVDAQVSGMLGLVSSPGKTWLAANVLQQRPLGTAANYGWYDDLAPSMSTSYQRLWQPLSTKHDDRHVDYSQIVQLVGPEMIVDGKSVPVKQIGADPELWPLVNHDGPITSWRQPSVPDPDEGDRPTDPMPQMSFTRTLMLTSPYMRGDDVATWQRFLGATADGIFGPKTDAATRSFQNGHQDTATGLPLAVDGKVGPATLRAANLILANGTTSH